MLARSVGTWWGQVSSPCGRKVKKRLWKKQYNDDQVHHEDDSMPELRRKQAHELAAGIPRRRMLLSGRGLGIQASHPELAAPFPS